MLDRQIQHHVNRLERKIARLRLLSSSCRRRLDFGQDNYAILTPQQRDQRRQARTPRQAQRNQAQHQAQHRHQVTSGQRPTLKCRRQEDLSA